MKIEEAYPLLKEAFTEYKQQRGILRKHQSLMLRESIKSKQK